MALELPASSTSNGASTPPIELPSGERLTRALSWLKARALFVVGVMAVLIMCFAGIPAHLGQDGWLSLLAGRIVASHGVPSHDYLTVMAHGVSWTDQQWLAQLLMYALEQLGGLQVLTVVYVLVTGAAFGFGLAAARRLGAEDLHVLMVLPAGAFFYLATAVSIRTQGFVYPLFVATIWLLASEFPRGSGSGAGVFGRRSGPAAWRAYLVLPILVVWANLHGSVTMGVGIVVVYGCSLLVSSTVADGWRGLFDRRGWSFIVLPPLTLFATPYGTSMVHYYTVTLLNSQFGNLVSEWRPVTAYMVLAVPLFVLIAATAAVQLRNLRRTPLFDQLLLAMLAVGAVIAVRNITWFGLATIILLPPAITRMRRNRPAPLRRTRLNLIFAVVMIGLALVTGIYTLARPDSWFESSYPATILTSVKRFVAEHPAARVFADVRYADWLVWRDPALAGRIAYDTSLELLTPAQLKEIAAANGSPNKGTPALLAPYALWLLYPGNHHADHVLLTERGVHVLVRNKHVIIATHPTKPS